MTALVPVYNVNPNKINQSVKDWSQAIKTAKVEYTFWSGRKFVLNYQGKAIKLSLNDIIRRSSEIMLSYVSPLKKYDRPLEEIWATIYNEKDLEFLTAIHPDKTLLNFHIHIAALDEASEKKRIAHIKSPNVTKKEKMIHWMLIVHRFFKSNLPARNLLYFLMQEFVYAQKQLYKYTILQIIDVLEANILIQDIKIDSIKSDILRFQRKERLSGPRIPFTDVLVVRFDGETTSAIGVYDDKDLKIIAEHDSTVKKPMEDLQVELKRIQDFVIPQFKMLIEAFENLIFSSEKELSHKEIFNYNIKEIEGEPSNKQLDIILNRLEAAKEESKLAQVYDLSDRFTEKQLNEAKKTIGLALHPDKNIGCQKRAAWLFNIVFPIGKLLKKDAIQSLD